MAVEAHHLLPFSPQLLFDRELIKVADLQPPELGGAQAEFAAAAAGVGKKRPRDLIALHQEELSSHVYHDMLDLDRLLMDHNERVRAELSERRRVFTQQLISAAEESIWKRLKSKEYEMERTKRVNLALEEKVRRLSIESQIWRELAQTNEANANLLRANLEQVLMANSQVGVINKEDQERRYCVEDAESNCCCGESDHDDGVVDGSVLMMRACRSCGQKEATVLLLPCRHLCLCVGCGRGIDFCPICMCSKSGCVNVNLS